MRRRFTLIELLVVVAIIAVLAAMLLPALARARATALTATCMNNQKQIVTALFMYCDRFDDALPWTARGTGVQGHWPALMADDLNPAVKQTVTGTKFIDPKGYLSCPAAAVIPSNFNLLDWCQYGMNVWGIGGSPSFVTKVYYRLGDVRTADKQIAFGDTCDSSAGSVGTYLLHPSYSSVKFPHNTRSATNNAYDDGHVATNNRQILITPNHFTLAPWGTP